MPHTTQTSMLVRYSVAFFARKAQETPPEIESKARIYTLNGVHHGG